MKDNDLISRQSLLKSLNRFAPEHYSALVNDLIMKEPAASFPRSHENDHFAEASKKATQLRTQMSSADCISRAEVDDLLSDMCRIIKDNGMKKGICQAWQQIKDLPSAQPEQRTCVNCGRTANNGGWYEIGRAHV